MSVGKKFRIMGFCTAALITTLVVVILFAVWNQTSLNQAQNVRFQSYLLADELRQSSDDLTRLARTYVVTGDSLYERAYWETLEVRNGKKARPDGRTVALTKLMEELGFTQQEFEKLKDAETNSNSLVKTETIAMHAMKGLFADDKGGFSRSGNPDTELARRIMHDEKYHSDKEFIMKPISEFELLLDSRTKSTVDAFVARGNLLLGTIAALVIITSIFTLMTVRSVQSVLAEVIGELKNSTSETVTSTRQLIDTSERLSSVSTQQASAIQETVSTLNQINATVDRSRTNARMSADVAQQSHHSALRGKDFVHKMKQAISEINESTTEIFREVESSNRQMTEIATIISEIGNKTKVINDIVFQTKLLSFNASVEAARAGEQGKGFAVVAEEVGNLATMSGNAAKEITNMLDASISKVQTIAQATTTSVNRLVRASQEKISSGVEVAEHCDESLEEIVRVVGDVNKMMDDITRATEEQAAGVNQITAAMNELDSTIQQTSAMASSTAHSATQLGDNTHHLQGVVSTIEREVLSKKAA